MAEEGTQAPQLDSYSSVPPIPVCRSHRKFYHQIKSYWEATIVLHLLPHWEAPLSDTPSFVSALTRPPLQSPGLESIAASSWLSFNWRWTIGGCRLRVMNAERATFFANKNIALYALGFKPPFRRIFKTVWREWAARNLSDACLKAGDCDSVRLLQEHFVAVPIGIDRDYQQDDAFAKDGSIPVSISSATIPDMLPRLVQAHIAVAQRVKQCEGQMCRPSRRLPVQSPSRTYDFHVHDRFATIFLLLDPDETLEKAWVVGKDDENGDSKLWVHIRSLEDTGDEESFSIEVGDKGKSKKETWSCLRMDFAQALKVFLDNE